MFQNWFNAILLRQDAERTVSSRELFWTALVCGIVQGSVFGVLLFNLKTDFKVEPKRAQNNSLLMSYARK